jgi:hypothetical protein
MAKGVALLRTVEGEYGQTVFIGERKRGRHGRKSLTALGREGKRKLQ